MATRVFDRGNSPNRPLRACRYQRIAESWTSRGLIELTSTDRQLRRHRNDVRAISRTRIFVRGRYVVQVLNERIASARHDRQYDVVVVHRNLVGRS